MSTCNVAHSWRIAVVTPENGTKPLESFVAKIT